MANEKMNELAVKIWSRHRAALEFLIDNQPNTVNELLQSIFDSNFIELVNTKLQSASLDLHLLSETKSARYLIFAVKEWDDFKGMIQKEGCSKSNRIFRLEIDFNKGGVRARWVVGPGPQNVRQSLIEAIEGNKTKFITKKFTSVASKSVVSKEGMDKLIEEGLADDDVKTVKGELVSYAIQTIDRFDTAFQESSLLIKNCN